MSSVLRISGLQMLVAHDIAENERRITAGIERAAADRAHFLLTPEGSLSGYHPDFDRDEVAAAVARVAAVAKDAGVGLALGTCYKETDDGSEYCYNQARVYSPEGNYLGFHAKILRCSSLSHPGTGEMKDYVEGRLRTFEWRGIQFGVLICNDLWATPRWTTIPNPYLPWKLWQMGAQMVLHAIHSGRDQAHRPFHESSSELWARALSLPIVQVNAAPADGGPVNAASGAIGPDGERLLVVPDVGEQYFVCDLPIAQR
jgi:predicted amidohydrolase